MVVVGLLKHPVRHEVSIAHQDFFLSSMNFFTAEWVVLHIFSLRI